MINTKSPAVADSPRGSELAHNWVEYRRSFAHFIAKRQDFEDVGKRTPCERENLEKAAIECEVARLLHNVSRDTLAATLPYGIPAAGATNFSGKATQAHITDVAVMLGQCCAAMGESESDTRRVAERVVQAALAHAHEVQP